MPDDDRPRRGPATPWRGSRSSSATTAARTASARPAEIEARRGRCESTISPAPTQRLVDRFARYRPWPSFAPAGGREHRSTRHSVHTACARDIAGLDDGDTFIEVLAAEFGSATPPSCRRLARARRGVQSARSERQPARESRSALPVRPALPTPRAPSTSRYATTADAVADAGGLTDCTSPRPGRRFPPRAPEVFVHPFRSNPYTDSGVFVHPAGRPV